MSANIQTVAEQVIILFILIGIGFIITKAKLLNKEIVNGLINLVVYVITPANIIMSFQREYRTELFENLLLSFLLAFSVFLINIIVSRLVIREKNDDRRCVLQFASSFPNAGYMALPLQSALLGDIGVFYGAVYVAMFHMYIWSYGVKLLSRDKHCFSIKKILFSPPIIAIAVGIIMFMTQFTLPDIIASPISSLAQLNTPVPMLIIGFYLANSKAEATFKNAYVYVGAFLRLVISPLTALLLCAILKTDSAITTACVVACSAPSAAMSTMLATKFSRNTDVSVGMISLTTILSILTMPLFIAFAR